MAPAPSSGDIVIGGINLNTINYSYVVYVIFSVVLVAGGTFALYSSANLGRTVIYAIGVSLIMLFFGMRWFGNIPSTSKLWPPTINMCPDYLTYISGTGCVDTLGVGGLAKTEASDISAGNISDNKKFGVAGTGNSFIAYTSANIMGTPAVSGVAAVPASGTVGNRDYVAAIPAVAAMAAVPASAESVQAVCNACKLNNLTWEGVWDGDTCLALSRFTQALAFKKAAGCS
uniref:Uncharacterized protein n=1 Tax=viral metagenome TaxID=1070528 RepID=A0A6C0KB70_9ZZZZ